MDIRLKFLAAILLFAAWGGLVLMHMTPVGDFVNTIRLALEALGIYHVVLPVTQTVVETTSKHKDEKQLPQQVQETETKE